MFKRVNGIALFVALLFAGVSAGEADAQALKVGYTDHEIIIVNMPDYKKVQEQLQRDYQGGQEDLQKLYQDYQEKLERYQKQQALLSEQKRQERERELMELQGSIQQSASQKEEQIAQREAELMQPLLQRVQTSIDKVAKQQGLDIVLRTQVGAQPLILYVNEKTIKDITEAVARDLGLDVDGTAENR